LTISVRNGDNNPEASRPQGFFVSLQNLFTLLIGLAPADWVRLIGTG